MICVYCRRAADNNEQWWHRRCTDCDCQHQPRFSHGGGGFAERCPECRRPENDHKKYCTQRSHGGGVFAGTKLEKGEYVVSHGGGSFAQQFLATDDDEDLLKLVVAKLRRSLKFSHGGGV